MTGRRIARALCTLAVLATVAAAASSHAGGPTLTVGARPSPQALPLDVVAGPADGSVPGERLAFADQRYRSPIFDDVTVDSGLIYRTAPDLVTGVSVTLRLDIYRPVGDSETSRPLLVWVHGGAFAFGNRSDMAAESRAYARLGYVTASISYRLDSKNKCLLVQSGALTGDELVAAQARCERAITGARDDAAAAVVWLRDHAATYGIDTTRVAIGGTSAGAITAIHVGQTLNTPGSPAPAGSAVSAVLAMSGCNYFDGTIDAFDAPIAVLASGRDPLVPFACSTATVDAAAAVGTPVLRSYFALEGLHAVGLYAAHQPEIDRAWRAFLIEHLALA